LLHLSKRGHIASENWVLKRTNKNKPQGSFAWNVLKNILMPIEVEESNLRASKSQSNILEALYNKSFFLRGSSMQSKQ
jgi:hypothetical protein